MANRWYEAADGSLHLNGAALYDKNEVDQANAIAAALAGVASGYRIARGQTATVTASDTVVTGLTTVVAVIASLDSAPVLTCDRATASIGNQSGAPAAGSILLQTWMPTSNSNPTPIAATTFSKNVNWIAIGT